MNPIVIVLPILLLLMFGLGLSFRPGEWLALIRQPKAVWVGLAAQMVVLLLLALGLVWWFRPEPYVWVGLMLIAASPGGSSSNILTLLAKGDVPLSVTLTVLSSVLTVFTLPPLLAFSLQTAGLGRATVDLPVGQLLLQNGMLVLLPMLLGMVFNHRYPQAARRVGRWIDQAAFPALLLLVTVFFVANRQLIASHFSSLVLMVSLLIAAAMAAGALLAGGFGLQGRQRRTIVIEAGIQNSAQAIAVAGSPFVLNNAAFAVPAVIYALLMNVILLGYIAYYRFGRKT